MRALYEGYARMGLAGVVFLVDGQSEGGCGRWGFRWAAGAGDCEGITPCGGSRWSAFTAACAQASEHHD